MTAIATEMDILKFTTVGSVDDGKSTLIGRLLYDSKAIFEDQLAAVEKTSSKRGFNGIDFALLTDGLAAEREQGITIDVAYRYFSTPKRKFIIADTPGHEQYTRNMVTGASTANLTIILIDARKGLLDQSRRHAFISSLLGIPNFIVAVNKMDLVDYSEEVFNSIKEDFINFVKPLGLDTSRVFFVPISALKGHNVVNKFPIDESSKPLREMDWYTGKAILDILETLDVQSNINFEDFRFPVQYVIREDSDEYRDFRGFAGQISSGVLKVGDEVISLPSMKKSKVKQICSFKDSLETAHAPQSVTLVLEDEIDTSRGDILVKTENIPEIRSEFTAYLCWMAEEPFKVGKKYLIKHCSTKTKLMSTGIEARININNLEEEEASELKLNEIAKVKFKVFKPLAIDEYSRNRSTGSFIIIDEITNNTVGAGMISKGA
jgi:sulfate adenylyltransferase subunit 1